jgi:hypothetical protein
MHLNVRGVSLVAAVWCALLGVSAALLPCKLGLEQRIATRVADAASSGSPEARLAEELARERIAEISTGHEYRGYSVLAGVLLIGVSTWFGYAAFREQRGIALRAVILATTVVVLCVADAVFWNVPVRYSVVRGKVSAVAIAAVLVWAALRGRAIESQHGTEESVQVS